jgi:bifunctional DNase/RNase
MGMREMRVVAIGVDPRGGSPVLLLREAAAQQRVLPVWVGVAEATAIELERCHVPVPRPLSHQLICQVIDACGRRLERVYVTSLREGTFHAELVIGPDVRVSARVSDAVAMALHQGVSIHAADAVLDQAAMGDVQVIGAGLEEGGDAAAGPVDESAELERMRRFLDDVNPEDFDIS